MVPTGKMNPICGPTPNTRGSNNPPRHATNGWSPHNRFGSFVAPLHSPWPAFPCSVDEYKVDSSVVRFLARLNTGCEAQQNLTHLLLNDAALSRNRDLKSANPRRRLVQATELIAG
jgi:hypothetical protein